MEKQAGPEGGPSTATTRSRRGAALRTAAGGAALFLAGGIVGLSLSSNHKAPVQVAALAGAPAPIGVAAPAVAAAAAVAAPGAAAAHPAAVTHSVADRGPRTISAAQMPAEGETPECQRDGSVEAQALTALNNHLKAAHFERSPEQQIDDIMHTDQYVKTHTVLVENMLKPTTDALPGIGDAAMTALTNHIKAAHLERSLQQQADDIAHTDQYVKTHTVLVQNTLQEGLDALSTGVCEPGEPDTSAPAPAPHGMAPQMPAPQAPAPAPAPQAPAPAPVPPPAPAPAPAPRPPAQVQVRMIQKAFVPATVKIQKGDTVVWTNADNQEHTVSSSAGRILSSGTLTPGKVYKRTFTTAGTYRYNCSIHPEMTGSVVVSG